MIWLAILFRGRSGLGYPKIFVLTVFKMELSAANQGQFFYADVYAAHIALFAVHIESQSCYAVFAPSPGIPER